MKEITFKLFETKDIDNLFQFERENYGDSFRINEDGIWPQDYVAFKTISENIIVQEKMGTLFLYLAICNNTIIGNVSVGIKEVDGIRTAILGCVMGKKYRMKGYSIEEGLKSILKKVRKEHDVQRVEANSSNRVIHKLLSRNGFQPSQISLQSSNEIIDKNSICYELYFS